MKIHYSLAACMVLGLLLTPTTAPAVEAGAVHVEAVDYERGTVVLAALHDSRTVEISLANGTSTLETVSCAPGSAETTLSPYSLRASAILDVRGVDAGGGTLWAARITLDPKNYRPLRPSVGVAWGKVVASRWTFTGTARRPTATVRAKVRETGRATTIVLSPGNDGTFTFRRVPVPYGPATFDITATNGFGSSPKATRRVYQLGSRLPKANRYELVCKRTLWMFDVSRGRVIHAWPIATGTPQTPTPSGTYRVGRPMPASGAWGVLRRRLTRVGVGPTRYYIHGTNAPWSIGMQASHGCVRMYNHHVRQFARVVPNNTLVRIR